MDNKISLNGHNVYVKWPNIYKNKQKGIAGKSIEFIIQADVNNSNRAVSTIIICKKPQNFWKYNKINTKASYYIYFVIADVIYKAI